MVIVLGIPVVATGILRHGKRNVAGGRVPCVRIRRGFPIHTGFDDPFKMMHKVAMGGKDNHSPIPRDEIERIMILEFPCILLWIQDVP